MCKFLRYFFFKNFAFTLVGYLKKNINETWPRSYFLISLAFARLRMRVLMIITSFDDFKFLRYVLLDNKKYLEFCYKNR